MDPYGQWSDQEIWKVADEVSMLTEVILKKVAHNTRVVITAERILCTLCMYVHVCVDNFKMENSNIPRAPSFLD